MEVEKRKKRVIVEEEVEEERDRLKKLKGKKGGCSGFGRGGDGGEGVVVPTEEEVEEFFAILRRMKVAVKYFGEKGRGGKEWREKLEQVEVAVAVDDDGENADDVGDAEVGVAKEKNDEQVIINGALDLNALAPEAAESGGA